MTKKNPKIKIRVSDGTKTGFYLLFLLLVILFFIFGASCTPVKRAKKAIKRIGAEPVAVALTQLRPDLLRGDTVRIDTTIRVPFEVRVPDFIHDTAYTDTGSVCKRFYYEDEKLSFKIFELDGKSNVFYKIKAKVIRDTVNNTITIEKPCAPCPSRSLVDMLKNDYDKKTMEQELKIKELKKYRIYFWVILAVILALVTLKYFLPMKKF